MNGNQGNLKKMGKQTKPRIYSEKQKNKNE